MEMTIRLFINAARFWEKHYEMRRKEDHKVEGGGDSAIKMEMNREERCRQNEATAQACIYWEFYCFLSVLLYFTPMWTCSALLRDMKPLPTPF